MEKPASFEAPHISRRHIHRRLPTGTCLSHKLKQTTTRNATGTPGPVLALVVLVVSNVLWALLSRGSLLDTACYVCRSLVCRVLSAVIRDRHAGRRACQLRDRDARGVHTTTQQEKERNLFFSAFSIVFAPLHPWTALPLACGAAPPNGAPPSPPLASRVWSSLRFPSTLKNIQFLYM